MEVEKNELTQVIAKPSFRPISTLIFNKILRKHRNDLKFTTQKGEQSKSATRQPLL